MAPTKRQRVLDALADALDDTSTDGGWLCGLDIWERCDVGPGSSFPILITAYERGEVDRQPNRNRDKPGLLYYRLTDAGFRRRQREVVRRSSVWARLWRSVVPALR